jgi:hypothetical protein
MIPCVVLVAFTHKSSIKQSIFLTKAVNVEIKEAGDARKIVNVSFDSDEMSEKGKPSLQGTWSTCQYTWLSKRKSTRASHSQKICK